MGKIESINPMCFDSGPGIRVEVILSSESGIELSSNELVDRIRKFRPYFGPDGGGVTFKGSIFEQTSFLIDTCQLCHKAGINTCIETTGNDYNESIDLLDYIDIVILNINSLPLYNYNNVDLQYLMNTDKLVNKLNEKNSIMWIKQIIKKDINDKEDYIYALKKYIKMYDNIENVILLSDDVESKIIDNFYELIKEV